MTPYPVYSYTAYGRSFRIEQPVSGAYPVTVRDAATGALLESTTAAGPSTLEAFRQVHRFENEAAKTGAKR